MSESQVPNGTENSQVEVLKSQIVELTSKIDALVSENTKYKGNNESIVEELKETRGKMQKLKDELASTQGKNNAPANIDVEGAVAAALAKRDKERADANKATALENFVKTNKAFHPENDPTGLKLAAFKQKLSRFNLDGLTEEKQFVEVFEDVTRLLGNTAPQNGTSNQIPSIPPSVNEPSTIDVSPLSSREKAVCARLGWTEQKYIDLKKKMPDYVAKLLKDY